jgi:hypothetical protein
MRTRGREWDTVTVIGVRWFVMLSGNLTVQVTRGLPFPMVYKYGLAAPYQRHVAEWG